MTISSKLSGVAFVCWGTTVSAQTIVTTPLGDLDFDKVCQTHSQAGYQLELKPVACGLKGEKCVGLTSDAEVERHTVIHYGPALQQIGSGRDPDL